MAQTIKLKRSATQSAVPTTSQLELGEVAINTYDGKMYIKKNDGTESIVEVGQFATFVPSGNDGELQYNNGGVAGAASFTFIDDVNNRFGLGTDTPSTTLEVSGTVTATAFDGSLSFSNLTNLPDPTLTLNGDVSGSATFTDLGNATLTVTIANDSHTHDGRYYTETELDNGQLDSRYYTETESDARFVNVAGDTLTGFLTLHADPTNAFHAATKEYVDTVAAASLHYHTPVRLESPIALNAAYNNGTNGVGATLTNSGTNEALTIDGVAVSLNDRVLVYEQSNAAHNGVYTVTTVGDGSTPWVLTRATDADSYAPSDPDSFGQGDAFYVQEGNTGAGELYVMNTEGTITFGTTGINFVQISSAQIYSAGSGLTLTGTQFAHEDTSTQASVDNSGGTVIQDITLDTFGHITAIGSKTLSTSDISEGTNLYYTTTRVNSAIDSRVDKTFVDALNVDADTLDGQNGTYYLDWTNVTNKPDPTLTLNGDVSGSATFTNLGNATLTVTVADDSHNHVISNVDGLQTALDAKQDASTALTTSTTFGGDVSGTYNAIVIANDSHTHDGRYYTEAESDARFLNVTGDTMSGNLIISKTSPKLQLKDNNTTTGSYPELEFETNNAQGVKFSFSEFDGELPAAGYGLILGPSDGNTQFPSTGTISLTVLGDIYAGATAVGSANKVFHDGYHPNADKWTTARTLSLTGAVTGSVSIDGSGNVSLATTATSDPTLTLAGDASGSATFTNLGNATLTVTVADDSHNHIISNVDGLQAALDAKQDSSTALTTSTTFGGDVSGTYNAIVVADDSHNHIISNIDGLQTALNTKYESGDSISVANITATGYLRGPSTFTIDPATHGDDTGTVVIAGNLQIDGTTTTINSTTVTVDDKNLVLASGAADASAANGAGLTIDGASATLLYNSAGDEWQFNKALSINGNTAFHDGYHPNADKWTTARTLTLAGAVTGSASIDGSGNVTLSTTATSDPTLTLAGDATGSATFTNLGNATLTVTVADDSHNHVISNVDGLQTALDGKVDLAGDTMTGNLTIDGAKIILESTLDFVSPDTTNTISLNMLDTDTLSFEGNAGQLFSITDSLSGTIFSVNDISGIPSIEVDDDGTIRLAEFSGNVLIGTSTDDGTNRLQVSGGVTATDLTVTNTISGNIDTADKWATARTLSLTGAVTGSASVDGSGNVSIATTHTADPTITLTGAVTGSGTMTNLGNVSIATTATADPTLTLAGDASGSATFTNLGNATLTVTVADDSHNHVISNVDGLQTALDGKLGSTAAAVSADKWTTARTLSLTGAVTGSASIDGSGNVSLATTATSDPTLTLSGDVTGSATFTNLGNATLTATVANDSHTHDGRYYTEDETNIARARMLGWVPTYSNNEESSVVWNDTQQAVELKNTADNSEGMAYQAIRMKSGDKVRIAFQMKASSATSSGVYARIYFYNGDLPDGKTHVSNDAAYSLVQEDSSGDTGWYENSSLGTSWVGFERTYTAPADGYMSLVILNWTGFTGSLYVKQPDIQFEKVNQATSANEWTTARTVSLTGAVTGSASVDGSANVSIATTHTADPTITLTGAVTGSGTMTNLGNVSIATTATADPTLTLAGDASGSATFTNLGNATLTVTVADDSHNHVISNVDGLQTALDAKFDKSGGTITGNVTLSGADGENALTLSGASPTMAFTDTTSGADDFFIHVNSNNFYVLTDRGGVGGYNSWETPHPLHLEADTNVGYLFGNRIFDEGYHPNADKWTTSRTLSLSGDASGSVSWDGSANATLTVTVADDSHNHTIANVDGLQAALDNAGADAAVALAIALG